MADDKRKTKKDILGELESIKSLLDDTKDDIIDFDSEQSDEELPVLTLTSHAEDTNDEQLVDHHPDEDDIPILTETFDSPQANEMVDDLVQVDKELDLSEEDSVQPKQAKTRSDDLEKFKQQVRQERTLDIEEDEQPETESSKSREIEGSLFDNLEDDFKQQWESDDEEVSSVSDDETNADLHSSPDDDEDEELKLEELEASIEPSLKTLSKESKSADNKSRKDSTESQPSLFEAEEDSIEETLDKDALLEETKGHSNSPVKEIDAPKEKAKKSNDLKQSDSKPPLSKQSEVKSKTESVSNSSHSLSKGGLAASQSFKAENPFLPKHIRDRLHTSRSLQDEIMDSPLFQTTAAKIVNSASSFDPKSYVGKSEEQLIIDQLVETYLPKIEKELRERLQEILSKSEQTSK